VWQGKQNAAPEAIVAAAMQAEQDIPQDALSVMYSRALGPVNLDGTEPVLGDPNAKYMVVEFADFGCGHCARAAPDLKALVASNPDIQLRFRAFALSSECNPALTGEGRAEPCDAAMAAECANQQSKFWEFSGKVFKNQRYLDEGSLAFQAGESGLDMAEYELCMANPDTRTGIEADGQAGDDAGIQGTPGLFLFGVRPEPIFVHGRVEYIEALVDAVESGRSLPPGGDAPSH
jgi:protein-disulfide isomerase